MATFSSALRRTVLAGAAALALATATGCAPVVSLHHTEVRGVTAEGLKVDAVMVIANENAFDVDVRRVRAGVTIADRYRLSNVDLKPNKRIPANRKVRVVVPVIVPWTVIPGLLAESTGSEVSYRVRGRADITAAHALSVDNYPIDQEGTIPRSSLNAQGALPSLPAGLPFGM